MLIRLRRPWRWCWVISSCCSLTLARGSGVRYHFSALSAEPLRARNGTLLSWNDLPAVHSPDTVAAQRGGCRGLAKIRTCMHGIFVVPRRGNTPSARGQIFSSGRCKLHVLHPPHTSGTMSSGSKREAFFKLRDEPGPLTRHVAHWSRVFRRLPSFTCHMLCHFGGTSIRGSVI
ncbi:hypothetical protein LZ32DRAFT_58750 [Colletotrichum eremochloae]|nr:hypothetical protein LZ32DRAFT_58750 [Colletotrichum eremochloae]